MNQKILSQARLAYQQNRYDDALKSYLSFQEEFPLLASSVELNIQLCRKKINRLSAQPIEVSQAIPLQVNAISEVNWDGATKALFDAEYYLDNNPDVKEAGVDPFVHYVNTGWKEGRNPNNWFDISYYTESYKDVRDSGIEPLGHYANVGIPEKRKPSYSHHVCTDNLFSILNQQNDSNVYQSSFTSFADHEPLTNHDLKLIAWYLPQYHPIKENDEAWGKGFTEWTNVTKALPQFEGHYQPRLAGELGYYDLRNKDILKRQIELAQNYGIFGFCFHYYWFNGRSVMDNPIKMLLNNPDLDFPFCINWANENWTKKWDGLDSDVILAQNHSPHDDIAFLNGIKDFLIDRRYIKINGRPLLMIYRPSLFPDITETIRRWRQHALANGIGDLFLVTTQSFEQVNPISLGFDAAVDFAPNNYKAISITRKQTYFNKDYCGSVYDYDSLVDNSPKKPSPDYVKFRSICPAWDNEARKPGRGTTFHNANPKSFSRWLEYLIRFTRNNRSPHERLLFINAWNEWAEGAYLEPDRKHGYSYLNSVYETLKVTDSSRKIIVVSHDAYYHGAQFLALNIARCLKEYFKYDVTILLCGEGGLAPDFEDVGYTHHLYRLSADERIRIIQNLASDGYLVSIANTSVVGALVKQLANAGIKTISLIHEMKNIISEYGLEESIKDISLNAEKVIFPSAVVKEHFQEFVDLRDEKTLVIPQGLFRKNKYKHDRSTARKLLLKELGLSIDCKIILNIAYGDKRKGLDIFVETGCAAVKEDQNLHFLWVGHFEASLMNECEEAIRSNGCDKNFHFVGFKRDINHYYAGSDLFFLSSREDPFPSVVLDAMNAGLPVIAFADSGGYGDILRKASGAVIPRNEKISLLQSIHEFAYNDSLRADVKRKSQSIIDEEYNFIHYIYAILDLLEQDIRKVSVVIPSFNYEIYIEDRILSLAKQTYPIYEIIFLDDASVDNSLEKAIHILESQLIPYSLHRNNENSGSVYKQWLKGIGMCRGDLVWIAECDDIADQYFLEIMCSRHKNPNISIAYSQSTIIDGSGIEVYPNVRFHTDAIDSKKWCYDYLETGCNEIKHALFYRNTIPNVSACVFKSDTLKKAADKSLVNQKYCGDWYLYIKLLQMGDIAYVATPLNHFRKHSQNVTTSNNRQIDYFREVIAIKRSLAESYVFEQESLDKSMKILYADYITGNSNDAEILQRFSSDLDSLNQARAKKILFVTFNEEFGGSEVMWHALAIKLSDKGHKVEVVCLTELLNKEKKDLLIKHSVRVDVHPHINTYYVTPLGYDLVIFSTGDHNAGGDLFKTCIDHQQNYIIINQLVKETNWPDDFDFINRLRSGYLNADKVFFTSKNNLRIFERRVDVSLPNAQIHYNPVDIERDDYVEYPPIQDGYSLAFPARLLAQHKGQDLLIEVLNLERWRKRNLTVNFYGDGPDRDLLKRMIEENDLNNINFCGYVSSLREVWEQNHAFVLTSRMEGIPLVLLSAMFAGRVPIVTNVGGVSEIIIDNETGFIASACTKELIDDCLERAWTRRNEWPVLGRAARISIVDHYPKDPLLDFMNRVAL